MELLIVLGIPLGAALVAGIPLSFFSAPWLVRICNGAIALQVGLVLTAWLLLASVPQRQNWRESLGVTCPDLDSGQGDALEVVAYSSLAVGAVALASAVLSVRRGASRPGRVLVGLAVSGLSFAIFIPLLFAALCGSG